MQSQMIGLQSTLDRILHAVQGQPTGAPSPAYAHPPFTPQVPFVPRGNVDIFNPQDHEDDSPRSPPQKSFPPLPGFAPPPHKYATYGIVPSTAPSSDDESEDTLPRSTLNAPIEALQGLANAAAEAAAANSTTTPRLAQMLPTILLFLFLFSLE